MRLIFAGTPAVALPSLDALASSGHDLVAVLTRPDAPSGRGRANRRSPVGTWADEHGIEVLTPTRPGDPEFLDRLAALAPDCVPVVAYGALVPPRALAMPRYGWMNVHFSLLPAWRGAAPVQHAVLHGDEVTGASVFQLEAGLDTGPVYGTLTEPIRPTDTAGELLDRLAVGGARLLVEVLDGVAAGRLAAVPQSADGVSMAPKLTVADARVRWAQPALAVDRRIRAVTPVPGAWTEFRGERLKLGPVTLPSDRAPSAAGPASGGALSGSASGGALSGPASGGASTAKPSPGGVLPTSPLSPGQIEVHRSRVWVGTGTGPVLLGEVRAAGKRAMPADAWVRGVRLEPGEKLT